MKINDILLESTETITVYHVTPKQNLRSIEAKGIIPQVGERVAQIDDKKAVYLFPTEEDMEDAATNWLGDRFDDEDELIALEIVLDKGDPNIDTDTVEYEIMYTDVIPFSKVKRIIDLG